MNFVLFLLFGLIAGVKTEANNTEEICFMEIDEGLCRGIMRRWAWNPVEEHCEPFEYGGCGGNGNNFDSQLECLDECWNKHVDEKYRKKPEPRCVKYIV